MFLFIGQSFEYFNENIINFDLYFYVIYVFLNIAFFLVHDKKLILSNKTF